MLNLKVHSNAVRRVCIVSVAALALIAGLSLAGVHAQAQATTQQQCITAFGNSTASNTCELETATVSGDDCTFGGLCQHNNAWHDTSITVDIDDADDLLNCSGSLATSC